MAGVYFASGKRIEGAWAKILASRLSYGIVLVLVQSAFLLELALITGCQVLFVVGRVIC